MPVVSQNGRWVTESTENGESTEKRRREAVHMALEMARQVPDWETFFREMMGPEGLLSRLFPVREERLDFENTPEYVEIQHIMARLRGRRGRRVPVEREITRVITVRMPESLHASLRSEAEEAGTSMNKLCITKLLQSVEDELIS